ncbi:esterase family protein [Eubacteriales bacterium OttesenSCG-928-N13]|nr:esterase family protein [Eubacteriales bacterium OttesenSCG-928-N13]
MSVGGMTLALLHVDFFSDVLGMRTEMDVILPQPTQGQIGIAEQSANATCQTLYLLHGMSDDHTIWQRRTSIERYVAMYNLAVVMPTTHLGWYTNMHMGYDYFTHIAIELVQVTRGMFRQLSTRREDTFVAGLSMGGYGALKLGLLANDTFSHAAALSGALDAVEVCEHPMDSNPLWVNVFGPADQVRGTDNDLMAVAERLPVDKRPNVFIWCGRQDFLYQQNLRMRDHLNALGYDLRYSDSPGNHNWECWDEQIQQVLQWLPLEGGGNPWR